MHKKSVLIKYSQLPLINVHADVILTYHVKLEVEIFGLSLHLHQNAVYASRDMDCMDSTERSLFSNVIIEIACYGLFNVSWNSKELNSVYKRANVSLDEIMISYKTVSK